MDIKERLNKETLIDLKRLARQLKATGYSKLKKKPLIDFIIENNSKQEIFDNLEKPGLKQPPARKNRINSTHIYGIITTLALIVMIFIFFYQESSQKRQIEKYEKANNYNRKLLERDELRSQGYPNEYVNGLGENPLLKQDFKDGQRLYKEYRYEASIEEFKKCLYHPGATQSNKVASHILIGICYYNLSMLKEAESHYNKSLNLSGIVNDKDESLRGKSAALGNIGLIYSSLGKPNEALKYQQESLAIHRKIGDEQGIAGNLGNIGVIFRDLGKPNEALKYHQEALAIARKIGYGQGIATHLGNIGLIYNSLGKPNEALKYHQEALAIDRKIGYEQGIASNLGNIGLIYSSLGKPDEALKYHWESLAIHRKIGDKQGIAGNLGNIGVIFRDLGKPNEALKYHQESLAIHREIGYVQGIASDLSNIGLIYSSLGKPYEALKFVKDALAIYRKIGYEKDIAKKLAGIGLIYSSLGKPNEALKYLKESLDIFKRINAIQHVEIVSRAIESIEKKKK